MAQQSHGRLIDAPNRVVIVGGGPAGCATALSLLAQGFAPQDILVIEASHFQQERIGESIPPDTRRLLAELGGLAEFLNQGHETCHGSASVWGGDEVGYNDFICNPQGAGWHLDRRRFDAWLAGVVAQRGVEVWNGVRCSAILPSVAGQLRLRLNGAVDCDTLQARFVVDATGARARCARHLGARRLELDRMVCVSGLFSLPHNAEFTQMTLLESVEYGWWYTARLPNNRIATALATSPAIYRERQLRRHSIWLKHLARTRYIAPTLQSCAPHAPLSTWSVPSFILDQMWGDNWISVGDAASAYDPLSSQGIYKALATGLQAGRAIRGHLLDNSPEALRTYQTTIEEMFQQYARQRAYYYDIEQRFPNAVFWRERRTAKLHHIDT